MDENRKVRMTKKVLKEALVELLLTKNIAKISVTELCDKADVNRSTFYSHYNDLEAVLNEIEEEFITHVSYLNTKEPLHKQKQRFVEYITYVREHKSEFLVLYENGKMIPAVSDYSMKLYREEMRDKELDGIQVEKYKYFVQYSCVGTFQMLASWLKERKRCSEDELAEWIFDLTRGIRGIV